MPAITYRVPAVPLSRPGVPLGIFRYILGEGYQPLPAVRCVEITVREGAEPSKAIFEYISSDYHPEFVPVGFEDALPLKKLGNPGVVDTDDRIVVAGMLPDGRMRFLFDGFAHVPETNFSPKGQSVTFQAQGVEYRLWDEVISYCVMRDAATPTDPAANAWTAMPVRFNPKIGNVRVGNQVDERWSAVSDSGRKFPVFFDALLSSKKVDVNGQPVAVAKSWSLYTAANYLLTEGNWDEEYVKNMSPEYLKLLLSVIVPTKGPYYDPTNPKSYRAEAIPIADTDVTGDPMPEALAKVLEANGYTICFRLSDDGENPLTWLDIYKINDNEWTRYKDLYLQEWKEILDPGASNVGSAKMAHDISNIVNVVSVDTAPVRYEVGIILAPLFQPDAADLEADSRDKFNMNHPDFKGNREKYRLFGADEAGEGHARLIVSDSEDIHGFYTINAIEWATTALDLTPIFGADPEGERRTVRRRRPPLNRLWTKDQAGEYMSAELYVSVDYHGPAPAIFSKSSGGSWYRVTAGFALCDDRLGIRVIVQKPNAWHIGRRNNDTPKQLGAGEIRAMEWLASDTVEERKNFALMLLCTIESDQHLDVFAPRRDVSPTKFEINRVIDMRSSLRPGIIHPSSLYHPQFQAADARPVAAGNTADEALAYAIGKRESRQLGRWAGQISIPRLVYSYDVGDRVRKIAGREVSMQTNLDGNGREAPVYPRVIGITWDMAKGQATQLVLTDKRSDYAPKGY